MGGKLWPRAQVWVDPACASYYNGTTTLSGKGEPVLSSNCKLIIFLGDGMGGRPVRALEGLTCLEAQDTPALDAVAAGGECGLMDPIKPGVPAGSDTAHMAILGYDPFEYYTGRGPFEARGVGLDVRPGDLAFRCNFATVEDNIVKDRRAGRITKRTDELAAEIQQAFADGIDGVQVLFKESVAHRAALVLRGEGLDHRIPDVDPHGSEAQIHHCQPLPEAADDPAAQRTAQIVNQFVQQAHQVLEASQVNVDRLAQNKLPANAILPRGVGTAPHLKSFADQYSMNGAMIVEVDLVRGLGIYLGMDVIDVAGATGGMDTDEMAIAQAVCQAVEEHDFILCNIKAPDIGGHDGDVEQKMAAIAQVDRALGYLLENLDWSQTAMMLGADHCTPISVQDHSGDAVPISFYGYGVRPDGVDKYGERACAAGSIHRITGNDIMNILCNYRERSEKFGA